MDGLLVRGGGVSWEAEEGRAAGEFEFAGLGLRLNCGEARAAGELEFAGLEFRLDRLDLYCLSDSLLG